MEGESVLLHSLAAVPVVGEALANHRPRHEFDVVICLANNDGQSLENLLTFNRNIP